MLVLSAPEVLCIYSDENRHNTYKVFQDITVEVNAGKKVLLDLSEVTYVTAAASLTLFATVNTLQLCNGENAVRCLFPRNTLNEEGHRWVVKTGLARALHSGSLDKLELLAEKSLFYHTSNNPNEQLLRTINKLKEQVDLTDKQIHYLTTGITEAMLNVVHHAYKDPRTANGIGIMRSKELLVSKMGERWWQCSWYDKENKKFIFIICDLGIGIPDSYSLGSQRKDVPTSLLKEAFTQGMSRFKGVGRGNGSEDIKSSVTFSDNNSESVLVYSGGVAYSYATGMKEPKVEPLSMFFSGTLVEWSIDC